MCVYARERFLAHCVFHSGSAKDAGRQLRARFGRKAMRDARLRSGFKAGMQRSGFHTEAGNASPVTAGEATQVLNIISVGHQAHAIRHVGAQFQQQ